MSLALIAAIGENLELGKGNDLCFKLSGDMQFFKSTTMGHPVIMGSKTWFSLPKKPLPGRKNIILTSKDLTNLPECAIMERSLDSLIKKYQSSEEIAFVIGGASVYTQFLPYCDKLYLTEVHASDPEADVFFLEFDKSLYTRTVLQENEENGTRYDFVLYERRAMI